MVYEIILNDTKYLVELDDTQIRLQKEKLQEDEEFDFEIPDIVPFAEEGHGAEICTTMPGQVLSVDVAVGQQVKMGQVLLVLESMKMENAICADRDCTILEIAVKKGEFVGNGGLLLRVSQE